MAILPIYTYGQAVLRKRAKPIKKVDDGLKKFVDDMFETMYHANGIGLAANQVGSLDRVIIVDISDVDEKKHEGVGEAADTMDKKQSSTQPELKKFALINPEIVSSEGSWKMEEGCLSIPDIRDEVERAETVRIRYKDLDLNDQEVEASGLLGRVLLHEIDHLNGVLFIDHLGTVKRKLLRGRLNKVERGETEVNYPVVITQDIQASAK